MYLINCFTIKHQWRIYIVKFLDALSVQFSSFISSFHEKSSLNNRSPPPPHQLVWNWRRLGNPGSAPQHFYSAKYDNDNIRYTEN